MQINSNKQASFGCNYCNQTKKILTDRGVENKVADACIKGFIARRTMFCAVEERSTHVEAAKFFKNIISNFPGIEKNLIKKSGK